MAVGILNMLLIRRLKKSDRLILETENSNNQITLSNQHVSSEA